MADLWFQNLESCYVAPREGTVRIRRLLPAGVPRFTTAGIFLHTWLDLGYTAPPMNEPAAEWVDIGLLKVWDKNPRRNAGAVAPVAESIKRFGFANPIIARRADGEVIAGHTRLLAAESLGLTKVPVRWMDLDPADAHLLAIADNKLGEIAEWDDLLLATELSAFSFDDAALAGFDSGELEALGTSILEPEPVDAEPQISRADELRVKWGVETGQLWVLGEHRLLCGDSTKAENVARVMCGDKADAVVSDPPYGMGFDASWYGTEEHPSPFQKLGKAEWDAKEFDPSFMFDISKNVAIFGANYYCTRLPEPGTWWVWDKRCSKEADALIGIPFELVWLSGKRAHRFIRHNWAAITARDEPGQRHHPTQKPVKVMCEVIEYSTEPESIVVEPFAGSGTTLLACEQLGRKCRAIEIDPGYVAVALQRWADATGKTPVLA